MPLHLTFAVTLIGFIAVNAARVVLQLFALELGASPTEVGVLVAVQAATAILVVALLVIAVALPASPKPRELE